MTIFDSPRLIADIGGQYARFALESESGEYSHQITLKCADFVGFGDAVSAYLRTIAPSQVEHAAVAIANPVDGDQVQMTNYHWHFSIEETRQQLNLQTLVVVNDFTALAMALPRLQSHDLVQIGGGAPIQRSVMGLLGAGSGLGVSGLIPSAEGWTSLGSEGGHTSFAPVDEREMAILKFAKKQFDHVSFERLASGPGIELIYQALCEIKGEMPLGLKAPEITQKALQEEKGVFSETLDVFCSILGTVASNLAVTLGAKGGVYVGGNIVPRLGNFFARSNFRNRFEQKGRFKKYVQAIPTYVITANNPTFLGVSTILDVQLRALRSSPGSAILSQIRRAKPDLSPAEMRVADLVLSQPRTVLNDPIHDIALAAQVSQPTVIRFCRSLGCKGLSDFKLRLASGLAVSVPVSHSQVNRDDSALELGSKVLGNTANAILQLRNELQRDELDRAIDLIYQCQRLEIFALGHYAAVANDAQIKFLRMGIPCDVHTDPLLQNLTAQLVRPDSVALIISSGGGLAELIDLQTQLKSHGTRVIAITANQSQLAKKSDVALVIEHSEHVKTHLPMVSRVLHLLYIDIIVVGLTMRKKLESGQPLIDFDSQEIQVMNELIKQNPFDSPSQQGVQAATPLNPAIFHSQ